METTVLVQRNTRQHKLAVLVGGAALAFVCLLFAYAAYERRWAGDDGFINLRVVSHLLAGNGFVFNVGERTEAVTSAAWILLLWFFSACGFDLESATWVGSISLSVIGLAMGGLGAARITSGDEEGGESTTLPFGIAAYAAIPVAWDYATSALENGAGLAFLGLAYFLVANVAVRGARSSTRSRLGAALFVGLAPLIRPDNTLYAPAFLAVLLLATSTWKDRIAVALATAAPGGLFQLFRMGYFAALVPNTALAKEAFAARWDQGTLYFWNTVATYQLLYPVAIALIGGVAVTVSLTRRGLWQRALLPSLLMFSGALHIVYVVRVGGDFMHGRMLLPGLSAIFMSVGVVRVSWRSWSSVLPPIAACLAMWFWAQHCASWLRPPYYADQILDERRWYADSSGVPNPTRLEHYTRHMFYIGPLWAKEQIALKCAGGMATVDAGAADRCTRVAWPDAAGGLPADKRDGDQLSLDPTAVASNVIAVYEMRPIGIIGRLMGLNINVVDLYGLADPLASRIELASRGRPGHEKNFPGVWFSAKYGTPDSSSDPNVALARRALHCGPLRTLRDATRGELTVTRFFKNVLRSFKLHKLRVPADPALAVDRFCKKPDA